MLLAVLWCVGIMVWANRLSARYKRLRTAYRQARDTNDVGVAVVLSQAMRQIREDLRFVPRAFNPIYWIRTLRRDYTARAAWELDHY